MNRSSLLALCASAACLAYCTTQYQVRGVESELERDIDLEDVERSFVEQVNLDARSVERYADVSLGILELTDQGGFNTRQKEQVMEMLRRDAEKGALIVVFAHGWHHGARVCDRDLACFRRVLHALHNPINYPRTIGIYLAWRGDSIVTPRLNTLSFWDRKRAAQHIGRTGGKELLIEIDQEVAKIKDNLKERPGSRGPKAVTVLTVGHSFGGALVFSAVRGKMIANLHGIRNQGSLVDSAYRVARASGDREDGASHKALRSRFGDLVVLINPAIEATAFKALFNDMPDPEAPEDRQELIRQRLPFDKHLPYSEEQLPILMTLASRADTAVGRIFPFGQIVWKLFHPWSFAGPSSDYSGMGRYGPHLTHRLTVAGEPGEPAPRCERRREPNVDNCECSKSYPESLRARPVLDFGSMESRDFLGLRFELLRTTWDRNCPYYVVETDCHVIGEHSDVFNEKLVAFLSTFVASYTSAKAATPERALKY